MTYYLSLNANKITKNIEKISYVIPSSNYYNERFKKSKKKLGVIKGQKRKNSL